MISFLGYMLLSAAVLWINYLICRGWSRYLRKVINCVVDGLGVFIRGQNVLGIRLPVWEVP